MVAQNEGLSNNHLLSGGSWVFLETIKILVCSIGATLDSIKINIINQDHVTLPHFQLTKMEGTGDLKKM